MIMDAVKERLADLRDRAPAGKLMGVLGILLLLYLLLTVLVGIYWSFRPDGFDVKANSGTMIAERGGRQVTGAVTTATLMTVAETLLDKPGGYLSNDIFPPGMWLDNMPNWEYGILIQVRDLSRALREAYSRSQSQSTEDPDLAKAEPLFNFQAKSWMLPESEDEYRAAIRHLRGYLRRLSDENARDAQFYSRADNLAYWLGTVETRLGSLSQRLSASVGQRRLNTDLAGDAEAKQSTSAPKEEMIKTPWTKIDDVFFEARGTAWALIQFMRAAEVDFAEVLSKKNAKVSLQQIIRELEATQQQIYSPMIMNGSGFGFTANHSLVMASYISRANAAIIDLRGLLSDG